MTKRIIIHVLGLMGIAIGVVLMIKANLGLFPMDAMAKYLVDLIPWNFMTIGVASFMINTTLMVICVGATRNLKYILSMINVFIFSGMLEVFSRLFGLLPDQLHLLINILLAFIGFLTIAVGTNFVVYSQLIVAPVELTMILIHQHLVKQIGLAKLILELCLLIGAILLAIIARNFSYLGWFTAIAILTLSPMIQLLHKPIFILLGGNKKNETKSTN